MVLACSPGPRALRQASALSRGTRASLTASAAGPSAGKRWRGLRPEGPRPRLEGPPPPTTLFGCPPFARSTALCEGSWASSIQVFTPRPHKLHHPCPTHPRGSPALPVPSKRAPQPAMAQEVPAGGSRGPWGRHTERAAPAGLTGVHSCTRARSLRKVRGSNWGETDGAGSMRRGVGVGVLLPALGAWGLPSHLRVGQDAIHRHLLRLLPAWPFGQLHRPQKLVRGAGGRVAGDTRDSGVAGSLETLLSAQGHPPSDLARLAGSLPGAGRRGPGVGRMRGEVGLQRSEPRLRDAGALRQESPEGGLPPPGGSRDQPSRGHTLNDMGETGPQVGDSGWAGGWEPNLPCEAVRGSEHPGRRHQDAAAQRPPAEL